MAISLALSLYFDFHPLTISRSRGRYLLTLLNTKWLAEQSAYHSVMNGKIRRYPMAWTRPKLREICIGLEINGYFAAKL